MSKDSTDKPDKSGRMSRRHFLGAVGTTAVGAAAIGAGAIPLSRSGELGEAYPEVKSNNVTLPSNGKKVLILGGGLSGLQAGVELSARGFQVQILEKTGTPGGKLKAWRDRHFGPEDDAWKRDPGFPGYVREHGIHAVWGFYNNLREFMGRHGWHLMEIPREVSMYHFRDKAGNTAHLPNTTWVAPYDHIELLVNLFHFQGTDRAKAMDMFSRLATFDYADEKQRNYLDSMTFQQYGRKLGLSDSLIDGICNGLIEMAYFDTADKVSALPLANLVQLLAGSPNDDLRINLYQTPVNESFLQPMVNFILRHGGEILYETEVTYLKTNAGGVAAAIAAGVSKNTIKRCSICGGLIFDGMEVGGECPYCGANVENLREIRDWERKERSFEADYVLCALDGPGLRQLIKTSLPELGPDPYFSRILGTESTSVYACNLWYPGRGYWEKSVKDGAGGSAPCFFASEGFNQLGITINKSLRIKGKDGTVFQWSNEYVDRDMTMIETQIAKVDQVMGLSTEGIIMKCHAELKSIMPDLPEPVSWYINRWDNYTAYHPGNESLRPTVQSPIDNLMFIGDNAFVPHPAVFMEKTNVTAKWATNLILDKAGMSQHRIKILQSGTPSKLIGALSSLRSVYL